MVAITSLLTVTSALAISFTLKNKQNTKIMPGGSKKEAGATVITVSSDTTPPQLPNPNYIFGSFKNSRNQNLFTINLPPKATIEHDGGERPPPKPNAMLFLVHGIGEHCLRQGYLGVYDCLSEAEVDVYSLDHHGHGRSDGERGYTEFFEHYVIDLLDYIKECQGKYTKDGSPAPPLVLYGQSMGALISVLTALRLGSYHVGGLILTSPALGVDMKLELKVQKAFAPMIDRFIPRAKIVDAVRPKDLSRNKKAVQAYINDPLVYHGKLIAHTAIQLDKSFDIVKERRGELTCPILILHGTDDKCTSLKASKDFFNRVGTSKDRKKFLQLTGFYHELLEEKESDHITSSIVEFACNGGKQFVDVEGDQEDGIVVCKFES